MSDKYVLDASALLALLQKEPGAEVIGQQLANSVISSINLAEVATVLNRAGMSEVMIGELFVDLDLTVLPFEQEAAVATGSIRVLTAPAGLSLGDRACLMTAKQQGRIALTADAIWLDYQEPLGVHVQVIR